MLLIGLVIIYLLHPAFFDFILRPSQRTIYERTFKVQPEKLNQWNKLYDLAWNDQVFIENDLAAKVHTSPDQPFTVGYEIELEFGHVLMAQISSNSDWILEARDSKGKLLADSQQQKDLQILEFIPEKSKKVKIILQSKLETQGTTDFKVYKKPRYDFPVQNKGNSAIQSFWGASRGGGSRSHEGNDIFAPKGHPVVAIAYGTVSSVRNRGLGGKQVWVKDYDTGYLHYYAHLDDWAVNEGDMVWSGDVLGYVGNTGNAATTPPHLHFGIYKNSNAVDPKPFIWQTQIPEDTALLPLIENARANGFAANLRDQPNSNGTIIKDLKTEAVSIIGNTDNWYLVRVSNGDSGFMHKSVVVEK